MKGRVGKVAEDNLSIINYPTAAGTFILGVEHQDGCAWLAEHKQEIRSIDSTDCALSTDPRRPPPTTPVLRLNQPLCEICRITGRRVANCTSGDGVVWLTRHLDRDSALCRDASKRRGRSRHL